VASQASAVSSVWIAFWFLTRAMGITCCQDSGTELAKTLIKASTAKKFTPAQYRDAYTEKMTHLIEAKVAGQEIVAPVG
jgi:non-homologous end joining protein Ku